MNPRNTLSPWQRRGIHACVLILLFTGLMWLSVQQLAWPAMAQSSMEGLPSPWLPWLMRVHGAAMMAVLFMVGRLSATHVMRGWRLHLRRRSGLTMLTLSALLALSGYALYYLVPEDWRPGWGWAHAAIGTLWALTLWVHRRQAPPSSRMSSRC